jgi:hypothetical protein
MREKLPRGFKFLPDGTLAFDLVRDSDRCVAQLPEPEIEIKFWLSDSDGNSLQKELRVTVLAGGLPGNVTERNHFTSEEAAAHWLQLILLDVSYQLPIALRTAVLLSIEESIHKASERFKVNNFDETKTDLSNRHLKKLRQTKSKALKIRKGPQEGRKWSRVTKAQLERLSDAIRQLDNEGEPASRANTAHRIGIRGSSVASAKSLDRALKRDRPNTSWRQIVEEARKKGR